MIEISDDAKEFIFSCLESALEGRPELRRGTTRIGLRLNFHRNAAYLSLAFPQSKDWVLTFMDRPLLIVGPEEVSRLGQIRLTVQQGPGGRVLSVEPYTPTPALSISQPQPL